MFALQPCSEIHLYAIISTEAHMIAMIVLIAIVAVIALWAIGTYNSLVKLRNKADEAEAGIDAHLQQRYDLVPNLVETVKGYAKHEEKIFTYVRQMIQHRPCAFLHQARLPLPFLQ